MKNSIIKSTILYIIIYYLIAIGIRYYLVVIKPDFYLELNSHIQGLISGISPLIGGLILVKIFNRPYHLKFWALDFWKSAIIIILPIFLFTIIGGVDSKSIDYSITLTIILSIIYAILEEYGWRGYLQSELHEVKPIYKYLIISVLWYFWHLNFSFDLSHLYFYFAVLAGSIGIGYVADKSKSLLIPSMFHMYYNVFFMSGLGEISFLQRGIILTICIIVTIGLMKIFYRNERLKQSLKTSI